MESVGLEGWPAFKCGLGVGYVSGRVLGGCGRGFLEYVESGMGRRGFEGRCEY